MSIIFILILTQINNEKLGCSHRNTTFINFKGFSIFFGQD